MSSVAFAQLYNVFRAGANRLQRYLESDSRVYGGLPFPPSIFSLWR